MKKLIPFKIAGIILILFMSLLTIFHVLILIKVLPSDIVWGSRLDSTEQILMMELIALAITILFFLIIILKVFGTGKYRRIINLGVWIVFVYFCLNILGNLASTNGIEKAILAPVALIMAFFTFRLAIEK